MKKTMIALVMTLCMAAMVLADDLSDYPDLFMSGSNVNAITIVGDKASATHVLAQTQIALSLANEVGKPIPGLARLASEVDRIDNVNVISIGNACDNPISAEILGDPKPCEKGLDRDVATIELVENENGRFHLVLNAYGDAGIKKLGHVLANYEDYELAGNVFEVEVEDEENRIFESKPEQIKAPAQQTAKDDEEKEEESEEDDIIEESTEGGEEKVTDQAPDERNAIGKSEPEPVLKDEDNFILKIINWFKNLFR